MIGNQNDSKMIGFQNIRNGKTTTMMMINKVNTMTPRQNDLVVKNFVGVNFSFFHIEKLSFIPSNQRFY